MADQSNLDSLETPALTTLLLNPDQPPEIHRGALSALARRSAFQRSSTVTTILRSVLTNPDRYDQDAMMALIDILATDPEAEATVAMIEVLPEMVAAGVTGKDEVRASFREYFYQCLVTRQRDADLAVWAEMLPELDTRTLVGSLIDPAAGSLEALEPLTLIDRLAEPQRSKALFSVVVGAAHLGARVENAERAVMFLKSSSQSDLADGIATLAQHWERAKKAGRNRTVSILEAALATLDTQPRTAAERLTGKRPWA
jgi:hypothetical protein